MMTMIEAKELKLDLRTTKGLHAYSYCVWQFENEVILVKDSDSHGYPSYFLSGLEDINKFNVILKKFCYTGKVREFELLGLARIIQTLSKAYGYSLAHFKAWQLIRLAKRR